MAEISTCISHRCLYSQAGSASVCPRCGAAMWPTRSWRIRGWVLIGTGLFLIGFVLALLWFIVPLVLRGEEGVDGARFTGDWNVAAFMFGLFALLLAFGAGAVAGGVKQVRTGRRSAGMIKLMLVLTAVLMIGGWGGMLLLGGDPPARPIRLP